MLAKATMAHEHIRPEPREEGQRWRACSHCLTPAARRRQRRRERQAWRAEIARGEM